MGLCPSQAYLSWLWPKRIWVKRNASAYRPIGVYKTITIAMYLIIWQAGLVKHNKRRELGLSYARLLKSYAIVQTCLPPPPSHSPEKSFVGGNYRNITEKFIQVSHETPTDCLTMEYRILICEFILYNFPEIKQTL
jgi:predicted acyltransferase